MNEQEKEKYAGVVGALHDADLALDAPRDVTVQALINVAVEAAFAIHGPERGRKLLVTILFQQLGGAEAMAEGGSPTEH
jgi:hypothetical protein